MPGHHEMAIRREICRALEQAGADFIVLSLVGSWGDTLSDADVLVNLRAHNNGFRGEVIAEAPEDE